MLLIKSHKYKTAAREAFSALGIHINSTFKAFKDLSSYDGGVPKTIQRFPY